MNNNIVYLHRNKINNKVYIGQTQFTLNRRSKKDGTGYKGCPKFYNAILKYGWNNFEHIILEENLTKEEAGIKEKYQINYYDSTNEQKGYNVLSGGKTYTKTKKQVKTIYCKETGDCFNTLSDAAEYAGLSRMSMNDIQKQIDGKRYFAGHHPKTKEPLHWTDKKENINTPNKKRISHNSKSVINILTLKTYSSISEANLLTGISFYYINKSCKNQEIVPAYENHEESQWMFLEDYQNKNNIIDNKNKISVQTKKVINLNTNMIFNSITEAAKWCGLASSSRIGMCCRNEAISAGKHPITKEKLYWTFMN